MGGRKDAGPEEALSVSGVRFRLPDGDGDPLRFWRHALDELVDGDADRGHAMVRQNGVGHDLGQAFDEVESRGGSNLEGFLDDGLVVDGVLELVVLKGFKRGVEGYVEVCAERRACDAFLGIDAVEAVESEVFDGNLRLIHFWAQREMRRS